MEKAFDRIGYLVHAKDAHKYIGGYTCPCCGEDVIKAEGKKQTAHFRHKVGGKRAYCDLYVQGLGSIDSLNDYATMMRIPYITFEEKKGDWDFYVSFPKIPKKLTNMFEDFNLYFNVTCLEMRSRISAVRLRHDSCDNKIQVLPRESYHFDIDNREAASKLQLQWPMQISGFKREIYTFQFLHGEFVRMEKEELSLNEIFYLVTKRHLTFHEKLTVQNLNRKNGWYAYRVQLPNLIDDSLIDWFYKTTGYRLKRPFYYLDLLTPSSYDRKDYAYAISSNMCSIAITFRTFRQDKFTVIHISPDMTSKQYIINKDVKEFSDLEQGFHTFYMKNHEGKVLNLYVGSEANHNQVINYESTLVINNDSVFIFKDKQVKVEEPGEVQYDFPFECWKKSRNNFPHLVKGVSNNVFSEEDVFYASGIWSFKVIGNNSYTQVDVNWSQLILAYLKIESNKTFFITNKQYQYLLSLVEKIEEDNEKRKLKSFIYMYRNQVPKEVKELLNNA